jgi:SAM-dependent methyltransferase
MSMDQANPDFNDAIEKYFSAAGKIAGAAGRVVQGLEALRVRALGGRILINERIVEYPMVFRLLLPRGRVLDVGCVSSRLPLQLASLGYEVHGVDLRPYPLSHPNFTFHQVDLLQPPLPFQAASFDIVTAVSCVEHFGLGAYRDTIETGGDQRILGILHGLLKPEGQLLLTVPFGRRGQTAKHRIYDSAGLQRILQGFVIRAAHYFRRHEGGWAPATAEELAEVASPDLPVNGVAVLDCRKQPES